MCGMCKAVGYTSETGHEIIDGLLSGTKWQGPVTYTFPENASAYTYKGEADAEFYRASGLQRDAASFALDKDFGSSANDGFSVEGFTAVEIAQTSSTDANIRAAQSALPSTAWAYLPGDYNEAGDVWFGNYANITYPKAGNYAWHTVMHEMGHAMGLKHGHEALHGFDALPREYDTLETSIMTYRTYEGGPATGYTYEHWGAPQTFMIADIAALQQMYGADFDTNSGDTVYSWKQGSGDTFVDGVNAIDAGGDVIFATIWDGGGSDTYDLSGFKSRLTIDLQAGEASTFNVSQLSSLGRGHVASGNIYNALQYEGDVRSLIENAIGGFNNDSITGNEAQNTLTGRRGNDSLFGLEGNDTTIGNGGNDKLYGGNGNDQMFGGRGNDRLIGGEGDDILSGGGGADVFVFTDTEAGSDTIADFQSGIDRIEINLSSGSALTVEDLIANALQVDADVLITIDEMQTIKLSDFALSDLHAGDLALLFA